MRDDRTSQTLSRVLEHAGRHPELGLGFARLPDVRTQFRDVQDLVDALQREWSRQLHERIAQLSRDPQRNHLPPATIARIAWAETAQRNPVLRRLLETHAALVDPAARRREELLITSGVAVA